MSKLTCLLGGTSFPPKKIWFWWECELSVSIFFMETIILVSVQKDLREKTGNRRWRGLSNRSDFTYYTNRLLIMCDSEVGESTKKWLMVEQSVVTMIMYRRWFWMTHLTARERTCVCQCLGNSSHQMVHPSLGGSKSTRKHNRKGEGQSFLVQCVNLEELSKWSNKFITHCIMKTASCRTTW